MNQKELVEAFVRGVTRDATNYEPDRDSDFEAEFTARRVVPPLPHANGMPLDVLVGESTRTATSSSCVGRWAAALRASAERSAAIG
jgi:hypothetical protein